jgi:hypothetical protein
MLFRGNCVITKRKAWLEKRLRPKLQYYNIIRGSLHKSWRLFLYKDWQRGKWSMYVWKHVTCTCNYYRQMGVYVQEPLTGGKQTTRVFNQGFTVSLWRKEWTWNKESREKGGCFDTSHPQGRKTFLTVSAEWAVALSCGMMAFCGLSFPNEVANIMKFGHEVRVYRSIYIYIRTIWW